MSEAILKLAETAVFDITGDTVEFKDAGSLSAYAESLKTQLQPIGRFGELPGDDWNKIKPYTHITESSRRNNRAVTLQLLMFITMLVAICYKLMASSSTLSSDEWRGMQELMPTKEDVAFMEHFYQHIANPAAIQPKSSEIGSVVCDTDGYTYKQ